MSYWFNRALGTGLYVFVVDHQRRKHRFDWVAAFWTVVTLVVLCAIIVGLAELVRP